MFEAFEKRVRRRAEALARRRAADIRDDLTPLLPRDVAVAEDGKGVALFGRGLARRFALLPSLRSLAGRLR